MYIKDKQNTNSSSSLNFDMSQSYAQSYAYAYGYPLHSTATTVNNKVKKNNVTHPSAIIEYDNFIFPDFKAIARLNLSNYRDLVYNEVKLQGYEVYLVEQWVSQRKLSSIITSYTGNPQDIITAVQITLPKDFNLWPGKFKQYYDELIRFSKLNNNHANPSHNDNIFITNLFNIPLSLNILNIIDGDMRLIWDQFKINYNLKMLNCLGRSSALLSETSTAAKEKFAQLYKVPINNGRFISWDDLNLNDTNFLKYEPLILTNYTTSSSATAKSNHERSLLSSYPQSNLKNFLTKGHHTYKQSKASDGNVFEKNNIDHFDNYHDFMDKSGDNNNKNTSYTNINLKDSTTIEDSPIIELIKLIQICLFYFNRYNNEIDGLFCFSTKMAIDAWWKDFGNLYYGISKPKNESILGPSSVSAIISLVLCSFYKLKLENCIDDTKNPFNISQFLEGIGNFQRKIGLSNINHNKNYNSYSSSGAYNFSHKIYLDHITLEKLFEMTAKFSNKDISNIKNIMKFKMKDLTSKNNLIQYSNDIATTDLDTLVKSLKNGYLNILWEIKNWDNDIQLNNDTPSTSASTSRNNSNANHNYNDYIITTVSDEGSSDFNNKKFGSHKNFINFNFSNGNPVKEKIRRNKIFAEYLIKLRVEEQTKQKNNYSKFNPNKFVEINFDEDNLGAQPYQFSHSLLSVSSMKPNYDKPKLTPAETNNLYYKKEFFRRNSIPFMNDGTNEAESFSSFIISNSENVFADNNDTNKNKLEKIGNQKNNKKRENVNNGSYFSKHRLYRCNSLSNISEFIDRWSLPFDPSIVKIAKNLKKINLEINTQEEFDNLEDYDTLTNYFSRECPTVELNKYRKLTRKLQDNYNKDNDNVIRFKGQMRSLDDKRQMLTNEMKEINSLSSKLNYDIKILELRVRDVEASINQFNNKLKHVKKSLEMDDTLDTIKLLNYTSKNDVEFEDKINEMFNQQTFCYGSFCLKVVKRDFFTQLKLDINSWINYFFSGIFKDVRKDDGESCQTLFKK